MCDNHEVPGGLSRRNALRGGLALAAGAATVAVADAPAMAVSASGLTRYNYIGTGYDRAPTRRRTTTSGSFAAQHPSVWGFDYGTGFHDICNAWANSYGSILRYMSKGAKKVSWYGCVGVYTDKSGNHGTGNAFDCSGVMHSNGLAVDALTDHLQSAGPERNRRYISLAWSGRKHMAETGIVGSHSTHGNHLHFGRYKNNSASLVLTKGSWDTLMIQYSCRAFMGYNTVVDGGWGSQTTSHYNELMRRLRKDPAAPFRSERALQDLAHLLCAIGVVGNPVR